LETLAGLSLNQQLITAVILAVMSCCFLAGFCFFGAATWRRISYQFRLEHPANAGRKRRNAGRLAERGWGGARGVRQAMAITKPAAETMAAGALPSQSARLAKTARRLRRVSRPSVDADAPPASAAGRKLGQMVLPSDDKSTPDTPDPRMACSRGTSASSLFDFHPEVHSFFQRVPLDSPANKSRRVHPSEVDESPPTTPRGHSSNEPVQPWLSWVKPLDRWANSLALSITDPALNDHSRVGTTLGDRLQLRATGKKLSRIKNDVSDDASSRSSFTRHAPTANTASRQEPSAVGATSEPVDELRSHAQGQRVLPLPVTITRKHELLDSASTLVLNGPQRTRVAMNCGPRRTRVDKRTRVDMQQPGYVPGSHQVNASMRHRWTPPGPSRVGPSRVAPHAASLEAPGSPRTSRGPPTLSSPTSRQLSMLEQGVEDEISRVRDFDSK